MIYRIGGRRELIIWHPEALNALDPETGKLMWSYSVEARSGLSVSTPRLNGSRVFITSFYNGSFMVDLSKGAPALVWQSKKVSERDTDGLHSIIPTPFIVDGYIYGVCSYGQLRCLRVETGDRIWETYQATTGKPTRWGNAFLTPNGDRWFLFNELGELIIARLTPEKYEEISRAKILDPTNTAAGRDVVWSHPAFANRCLYARNDREIICVSLAASDP
jgi:outer membrane protein assembly factor BamB